MVSSNIKIFSKLRKIKPWATAELIKAITYRDLLHLKVKKTWLTLGEKEYTHFKNKVTHLIRNAKNTNYESELKKTKGNPKMSWKLILNDYIDGRGNKQNVLKSTILHDGKQLNVKTIVKLFQMSLMTFSLK